MVPDDALVVRGGKNLPADILRGMAMHPVGVLGVSAECREGLTIEELTRQIPHGQVGVTSVRAIRSAGGDVIRIPGRSPHHVTITGLSPDELSGLLTPNIANPAKRP